VKQKRLEKKPAGNQTSTAYRFSMHAARAREAGGLARVGGGVSFPPVTLAAGAGATVQICDARDLRDPTVNYSQK
jgi:hypothetical protein